MIVFMKLLPMIGSSLVFMATEVGYFLAADQFQSENRTGWLAGDRVPMLVTITLFAIFLVSFFGTFEGALLLPFSAVVDALIGLVAVSVATVFAYVIYGFIEKRRTTEI
ncbi:hypothetical protein [Roseibium sp. RKSG952]|uniref:hypothetical protein n=1 Tax=Roseibium sp. RKSG952 TaxID=2529384 RepID=UPI0012BB9420|nr:hypothetical protein [Roseibium sp. RKSG952]MTH98904.1 hypothetical protein [Roseibium sp. RKSG952]